MGPKITAVVKGPPMVAVAEALRRGITVEGARLLTDQYLATTRLEIPRNKTNQDRLARWMVDQDLNTVKDFGYPNGSLLAYTGLG